MFFVWHYRKKINYRHCWAGTISKGINFTPTCWEVTLTVPWAISVWTLSNMRPFNRFKIWGNGACSWLNASCFIQLIVYANHFIIGSIVRANSKILQTFIVSQKLGFFLNWILFFYFLSRLKFIPYLILIFFFLNRSIFCFVKFSLSEITPRKNVPKYPNLEKSFPPLEWH